MNQRVGEGRCPLCQREPVLIATAIGVCVDCLRTRFSAAQLWVEAVHNFYLHDLPCTSSRHAQAAEAGARDAGLRDVRVGNRHLLDTGWV